MTTKDDTRTDAQVVAEWMGWSKTAFNSGMIRKKGGGDSTVERNEKMDREILDAVRSRMDDDLERARFAFRGLTEAQMNEEHGMSGKTRLEILRGYENRRREDKALVEYAEWRLK